MLKALMNGSKYKIFILMSELIFINITNTSSLQISIKVDKFHNKNLASV